MNGPEPDSLEFGEVTFALPAQQFGITCSLTDEEALPVVTEFSLRVIHSCEAITPRQLQVFFGFTEDETTAVISTLTSERLVQWDEDSLEVTPYARAKFIESPDGIPRFFRIRDFSRDVTFDLMSFLPASDHSDRLQRAFLMVELAPRNAERESKTKFWAEQSFQENFHQINRGKRAEIYKISEVEPGERFLIPLSCRFGLRIDGGIQVSRSLSDANFDNKLEIAEAISEALGISATQNGNALDEFCKAFDGVISQDYFESGVFSLSRYVDDVYLRHRITLSAGVTPIIGSLHMAHNRRILIDALKELKLPSPVDAYWIAPQARFWSRSRFIRSFLRDVTSELAGGLNDSSEDETVGPTIKVLLQMGNLPDHEFMKVYCESFPLVYASSGSALKGKVELFMVPGQLVCAIYHHYVEESPLTIPLGFVSSRPDHLKGASAIMHQLVTGDSLLYKLDRRALRQPVTAEDLFAASKQKPAKENATTGEN
jgi:hypothetical protein